MVISNVPADAGEIAGLVYVCAFAPEAGDTCNALAAKFPGSTLGETLRPVPRGDGTTDLYIATERFHAQFCADVPAPEAARMAVTQRPPTLETLTEPSGDRPLWRQVPSWFLIGEQDHTIPAALQRFMAERAGAARAGDSRGVARGRRLAPRGDSRADPPGRGPARDRLTCACGWRSARQPAPRSPGTNHVTLEER
jgi:pimeloyl-ACP methyl ester carboxylesterase